MDIDFEIHNQRYQRRGHDGQGGSAALVSTKDGLLRGSRGPRFLRQLE